MLPVSMVRPMRPSAPITGWPTATPWLRPAAIMAVRATEPDVAETMRVRVTQSSDRRNAYEMRPVSAPPMAAKTATRIVLIPGPG